MELEALISWLIVGGIAGWLAGKIMTEGGFGLPGDIVVGIVGSVIAGWLFGSMYPLFGPGFFGAIISATLGAVFLLFVLRVFRLGPEEISPE